MGRPRLLPDEISQATSITLSDYHMRLIEIVGGGNRSAGVRRVIDFYIDQTDLDFDELVRLQQRVEAQLEAYNHE